MRTFFCEVTQEVQIHWSVFFRQNSLHFLFDLFFDRYVAAALKTDIDQTPKKRLELQFKTTMDKCQCSSGIG